MSIPLQSKRGGDAECRRMSIEQVVLVDKLKKCYSGTRNPWTACNRDGDETEGDITTAAGATVELVNDESVLIEPVIPSPLQSNLRIPMNTDAEASPDEVNNPGERYSLRNRETIQLPRRYQ